MKRIWKKMMAILMAVFLVCTTLVLAGGAEAVSALAEAGGNTPEVTDGADAQQFADNSGDIIIGNISIELDQLIKNHYMVTVPVTMPNNPGFTVLQFGVKWDVTRMSVQGARSTGNMKLPILTIANDKRQIWMMFIENDCKETNISSLTAEINPDVKVGDTFVLEGAYADYADNKALYKDKTMKSHDLNIVSGTITIVDSVVPEVKLQIGEVRPSMRDLDENDYMVEVPVTAEANNGFSDMVFGFRWDASKMTAEPPSGNIPEGLSLIPTIDNQSGVGWIHVIADSTYTGSDICTLRFTVPDNTKPGSIYDITGCSSDGDTEASVANHSGTAGTLTINNGRIFATSTQAANSFAFGKVTIPDISISMEDLEQSDHLISVPITITSNSCFTMLAFGVSWDTNDLSIVSCTCDDTKNLGMIESYSDDNNGIWMQFLYRGPYDAFTGTALCTLTFRVRSDISLGDKIMLNPQELSPDGDSMIIVSTKGTFGDLNMQKGTISLVSANELTAAATVKISDVEIDTYHLWLKSYVVDVPIVLKRNTGVSYLSMGVFYDETIAQAKELQSVNIDQIGVMDDFSQRSGEVVSSGWLEFHSVDPSSGYVYSGTTLGVLKIKLDESVKAGDVIDLSAASLSLHMIHAQRRDDRTLRRVDDVGGIQRAAQAHLQHHDVAFRLSEPEHPQCRDDLELGGDIGHGIGSGLHTLHQPHQRLVRDLLAVYLNALVEPVDKGRSIQAHPVTRRLQAGSQHGRRAALAIGARHMDESQLLVRISQCGQQGPGAGQARLVPRPLDGMDIVQRFFIVHCAMPRIVLFSSSRRTSTVFTAARTSAFGMRVTSTLHG